MNKDLIKKIVRNITFEVSDEFGFKTDVKLGMEFDWSIDFEIEIENGLNRSITVRHNKNGYIVSNRIHSPTDNNSDLLQQIVCGRVAERLLNENRK